MEEEADALFNAHAKFSSIAAGVPITEVPPYAKQFEEHYNAMKEPPDYLPEGGCAGVQGHQEGDLLVENGR